MLATADLIAFIPTTDLARARAFYVDLLGLPVKADTPFACVLDAAGTMVRVTPVDVLPPRPYTVLGWAVDDIDAAVRQLGGRGLAFSRFDGVDQDRVGVWTAPGGDQIAWFTDPDGNTLSLTQFAAGDEPAS
ncbi:MAG: VOC family protein [Frankia sp.]